MRVGQQIPGGLIQLIDTNGVGIWDYLVAGAYYLQHFDIEPMPKGNTLTCQVTASKVLEVKTDGAGAQKVSLIR